MMTSHTCSSSCSDGYTWPLLVTVGSDTSASSYTSSIAYWVPCAPSPPARASGPNAVKRSWTRV
jgi:hypothetical protein